MKQKKTLSTFRECEKNDKIITRKKTSTTKVEPNETKKKFG